MPKGVSLRKAVGSHDDQTISYCQAHNITYEAYSPLRRVNLDDKRIAGIAANHNASTAQVALRWITQQGVQVATSPGANKKFAEEDLQIFDFELTSAEMTTLSGI